MGTNSIDRLFNLKPSPERPPLDFTVGRRHTHRHGVDDAHRRRLLMLAMEEMNSVGGNALIGSK